MKKTIFEVTLVKPTKNARYAKVFGYAVETGETFAELYGKADVLPLVAGDQVTLSYKKHGDVYYTFVNKLKK